MVQILGKTVQFFEWIDMRRFEFVFTKQTLLKTNSKNMSFALQLIVLFFPFSTRPYTYDDHPGDETLSKFALQPEDLNYKVGEKSQFLVFDKDYLYFVYRFHTCKWHRKSVRTKLAFLVVRGVRLLG